VAPPSAGGGIFGAGAPGGAASPLLLQQLPQQLESLRLPRDQEEVRKKKNEKLFARVAALFDYTALLVYGRMFLLIYMQARCFAGAPALLMWC
jgi:hypothetical protein